MKPHIESVSNSNNFNWLVKEYNCHVAKPQFQCPWHYHSEYELVLYRDPDGVFNGNCFVGDFIGPIEHNSLVLYGPGLPHMLVGSSLGSKSKPLYSLIFWFTHAWVEQLIAAAPELHILKSLLRRSGHGLQFSPQSAERIYALLKNLSERAPHHQIMHLLEALSVLADDNTASEMSSSGYALGQSAQNDEQHKRVESARRFIEKHFHRSIKIHDVCQALHMSESSAYRLFERHFNESFSEHLKSFRIGKACELLVNSQAPIALVAEQSGFTNLSNFNRQFKSVKGMTPRDFRVQFNR